ncbi:MULTISPECIES: thioredoxin family protein [Bacillaceae]|uniref:Thioredoxin family protein n=1 Tax=Evansella alkalicola TaxID=745819 RepID=A0ABS6JRG9_9BACI|nr:MULTISPECIES: thioredoxin family protein [Bacillaceae]MBU9721083.1 thioredoxin family protein [Bacillus alkalicola]
MKQIESKEQFRQATEEQGSVFMFTAGWCPDCVFIEPHLLDLEDSFKELTFYKVNRDDFIELCQDLDIFGIPSFLVYKNGKEVHRYVDKNRKTKEEIEKFLNDALSK